MRAVVADTGPLNYLVLIGADGILPRLFRTVLAPETVANELRNRKAPPRVREWIATNPDWLAIEPDAIGQDADLQSLEAGERMAIMLAQTLNAQLILMDDRKGVAAARAKGFAVTGTLGLLDIAARRGLIDLPTAFDKLRATSFRFRPALLEAIMARHQTGA